MHQDPNRLALLRQRLAMIEQAINLLAEAHAAPVATLDGQDEEAMADQMDTLLESCRLRALHDLRDAERYHSPPRTHLGRLEAA